MKPALAPVQCPICADDTEGMASVEMALDDAGRWVPYLGGFECPGGCDERSLTAVQRRDVLFSALDWLTGRAESQPYRDSVHD